MKTPKIILAIALFTLLFTGTTFMTSPSVSAEATLDNPVDKKDQASCSPFETPTQIQGGKSDGKWYCKSKSAPGQGQGGTDLSSSGCSGGTCGHQCGADDENPYTPSIDLGCKGQGNPILDTLFGVIHFLSDGVGLVVVGSIIVGGIQYSGSRGDPQATALAVNRIRSSLFALLIFIFAYAAINYIIPGAILK